MNFIIVTRGMTNGATTNKNLCVAKQYVQVEIKEMKFSDYHLNLESTESDNNLGTESVRCKEDTCTANCTSGWEEKDGQCYFWSQEKLFWEEADGRCSSLGGHLASVTTQDEYDYLMLHVCNNL